MNTLDCLRSGKRIVASGVIFLALVSHIVAAQTVTTITTDTSWDRAVQTLTPSSSNTVVTGNRGTTYAIPGNVYTIAEAQGKLAGTNLFHSFESFSIGSGDAAVFTTTTPTLNNVISRVSGTSPTTINGLLALVPAAGSNPNFFFVNPNGITFGAGAQVDVPAAFHVSTADNLRFTDGTVFRAGNGSDSTLTIAPPEAFGFLGHRRGAVSVGEGAGLTAFPGQPLSVSAADIRVDRASLVTEGMGDIRLTAVGADVLDVPLTGPLPVAHGTLAVVNGAAIVAFTLGSLDSGNIAISAGDIRIDGQHSGPIFTGVSTIAFPGETGHAGNVSVQAAGNLVVVDGGLIASQSYSVGNAGSVTASAKSATLDSLGNTNVVDALGFFAQTGMYGCTCVAGSPGSIGGLTLAAEGDVSILNGARILSRSRSSGTAGPITVRAGTMIVDGQVSPLRTGIDSQALNFGDGAGVDVMVAGQLSTMGGGVIGTLTTAVGDAGHIKVMSGILNVGGEDALSEISTLAFPGSSGLAGDIDVVVEGDLTVLDAGSIRSLTGGTGSAGSVRVDATNISLKAPGGPEGFFQAEIASGTVGPGHGGSVEVNASETLAIGVAGIIDAVTFGQGNAGSIKVTAKNLSVDGQNSYLAAGIFSTNQPGVSGNAGNIEVDVAGHLALLNTGRISASTVSSGTAGSVHVNTGSLIIEGASDSAIPGVFSVTTGAGDAGNVAVSVRGALTIGVGGGISASTGVGTGNAGSVKVSAGSITMESLSDVVFADISSSTRGPGNGGDVEVSVGEALSIGVGGVITAATSGTGNAGSVKVSAKNLIIDAQNKNAGIQAQSSRANSGSAGGVSVSVHEVLSVLRGGTISSETKSLLGHGGSVVVDGGTIIVDGIGSEITTAARSGSSAETGNLTVTAREGITLSNGGTLSIRNDAIIPDPTSVLPTLLSVSAPNITLVDAQITTQSSGNVQGGDILISAGQVTVAQLGSITAETFGKGKAGNVTMTGDSLAVMSGGRIEASTSGEGKGGSITISTTGDVIVSGVSADGQTRSGLFAKTQSPSTGTGGGGTGGGGNGGGGTGGGGAGGGGGTAAKPGGAGNIAITAKNLLLNDGAQIDSSTTSGGAGGSVSITTTENITIAGSATSLKSDATRGNGQGGNIAVVAKNITVSDGASVTAATGGKGDAGSITLTAVDQLLLQSSSKVTTSTSGDGKGGSVVILAGRVVLDGPDTAIIADTLRPFADLTITINILHANDGDLVVQLDSPTGTRVALLSRVGGNDDNFIDTKFEDKNEGKNPIASGSAPFTGTFTPREPLAQLINELAAGNWTLNVRDQATGNVGTLQNWTLQIGGQTFQSAGAPIAIPDNGTLQSTITVANPNQQTVQGTGEAKGIGGDVTVNANSVTVQNGATMSAITRGSGKGGIVNLQVAGDVSVLNLGTIATDTFGSGRAGDVHIKAQNLVLNRGKVSSDAQVGSSGQTGSLVVDATNATTLSNGGILSIRNDAHAENPGTLSPTLLSVSAHNITLKDSKITAESTGNVDASDIDIKFTGRLWIDPSSITTSANLGNGGKIAIGGGQLIQLDNSQITTSVGGVTGNGGDINIQANSLVLNTGFIQANTAAAGASGGNVNINVQTLLPSGNSLTIGGSQPAVFQPGVFGLNVIQAAAPTGVSGTIHSTVPTLDVAGDLSGLTAKVVSFGALGKDLCRMGARSSFTPVGRGGLRASSTGMIRPEGALAQTTAGESATGGHAAIADMRDGTRLGALAECRY